MRWRALSIDFTWRPSSLADLLVAAAVDVERQDLDLEAREDLGEALAHRAEALLRRRRRSAGSAPWRWTWISSSTARSPLSSVGPRRGDRHVLVEGLVLLARGRLDRGDDLARDAELGEGPERGLVLGPEVAGRLVEADERLLLDVVARRRRRGSSRGPWPGRSAGSGRSAPRASRSSPAGPARRARRRSAGPVRRRCGARVRRLLAVRVGGSPVTTTAWPERTSHR